MVAQAIECPLVDKSDEQVVMAEMEKTNVHNMRLSVVKEIQHFRKYIP